MLGLTWRFLVQSVCSDNLGLGLVILGLLPQTTWPFGVLKLIALWVLVVIGFLANGLLIALVWMRLGAPDVALTEAIIGGGLVSLLLLGASAWMPREPAQSTLAHPDPWPLQLLAALLAAVPLSCADSGSAAAKRRQVQAR